MTRVRVSVVVLSLGFVGLAGAQAPVLAPAGVSPFDVGAESGQVLLADINKDGHLDLLTRHPEARAIRTHLGDGRARFTTAAAAVALDFAPADMELGDVNGGLDARSRRHRGRP
jgi:hypothetical protein